MASTLAAAIPAALSAFSNQGRTRTADRPTMESALPVLAAADKKKLTRLRKEADKERIYNLLTQPEVLGLVMTLGGIFASNNIKFSSDEQRNLALQSAATSASVLLGLGHAGVGDLTTMIVAAAAGGGSLLGGLIGDTGGLGGLLTGGLAGTQAVTGGLLGTLDPTKWENWVPGYNLYSWLK